MITGFNPTDMYAADHIRRVLQTFPGVFSGIGEFTIHKEFVVGRRCAGRRREPHRSRARPLARLRRRGRAGGADPQRRGPPVPAQGRGPRSSSISSSELLERHHHELDHLGARGAPDGSSSPVQGHLDMVGAFSTIRPSRTCASTSRRDEVAKYAVQPEAIPGGPPISSTSIRIASCSAATRSRHAIRRPTSRSTRCTSRCGSC